MAKLISAADEPGTCPGNNRGQNGFLVFFQYPCFFSTTFSSGLPAVKLSNCARKKQHGLVRPIVRMIRAVRREQDILQAVERVPVGQRLGIEDIERRRP